MILNEFGEPTRKSYDRRLNKVRFLIPKVSEKLMQWFTHYRVSLNHRNLSKEYGGDFGKQSERSIIRRLECDPLMMLRTLTKVNLREPIRKKDVTLRGSRVSW